MVSVEAERGRHNGKYNGGVSETFREAEEPVRSRMKDMCSSSDEQQGRWRRQDS